MNVTPSPSVCTRPVAQHTVVLFPKQKKRGRKTAKGVPASVVRLCVAEELEKRWAWLHQNHKKWDDEALEGEPEGFRKGEGWQSYVAFCKAVRDQTGRQLTPEMMRAEVAVWTSQVKQRTAAKNWLENLGINWDECRNPEDAVLFLFDRFGRR